MDDYFGTKVSDRYRWLENDSSAEVKSAFGKFSADNVIFLTITIVITILLFSCMDSNHDRLSQSQKC